MPIICFMHPEETPVGREKCLSRWKRAHNKVESREIGREEEKKGFIQVTEALSFTEM